MRPRTNTHVGARARTQLRLSAPPVHDYSLISDIGNALSGVIGDVTHAVGHAVHSVGEAAHDVASTVDNAAGDVYHAAVPSSPSGHPAVPHRRRPAPLVSLRAPEASALGTYLGRLLTPGGALSALLGGNPAARKPLFTEEGPQFYKAAYEHNAPFAKPGPYQTQLTPAEEQQFRQWVHSNDVPFNPNAHHTDYDMRGYWKKTHGADWSPGQHFPDTFKTPLDTSFSNQSRYAKPDAPRWEGDRLVDPRTGRVVFAERPRGTGGSVVDPLGRKTLGNVTAAELQAAKQTGTLRVSRAGVISTPQGRSALHDLLAAQRHVTATNGIQTGLGPNADAFAQSLADYTHLSPRAVGAWVASEGGAYEAGGAAGPQNWLGVGYPGHPTAFGQSPNFSGTPEQAGRATGAWMEGKIGGGYGYRAAPSIQAIVPEAAHAGPQAFVNALATSGWGTDVAHVQQNLANVNVRSNPQAVQALQVAKHNARAQGINPTPFNGDVTGGGDGFTVVRADAKGMVDWAESAVGTQEGSGKQQRWAGKFGLGTTEPWCANFVSNGLLRRGFDPAELPANPNNTGTPGYEQWASEGKHATNVGTDLRKAKPGDVLTFSGAHTALYVGNGEMISGNFSDEVERTPVTDGPAPLSMIIRPRYKGGKVRIADAQLAGSTAATATGTPEGGVAVGAGVPAGASGGPGTGRRIAPQIALAQLAAPVSAGPTLPDAYAGAAEAEPHVSAAADAITTLLGEESPALGPLRRPSLGGSV